ncbi:MAG: MiaB/RimO family radical SAM methylthiotransferase, partial [Patescibacteria group bacterium]
MKYYIKTFGCQMNISDSERIAGFLEENGLKKATDINQASLVVLNTCGVRQMAEDRVYGQIHNLRQKIKNHKLQAIILTGCLANRKDVQRRLKNKVDLFFSISNFKEFESWIIKNFKKPKTINYKLKTSLKNSLNNYFSINPLYSSRHTAFVPIMTGCNNFCAYCVVPYARGREISRSPEEIISEIKNLVKKGYKEIFLLGQNVNSYNYSSEKSGRTALNQSNPKRSDRYNFSKLLKSIDKIPGKFWINFLSNHPKDITPEFIETVTKLKKVCELIHLPLQAGDDEILEHMNRKYTSEDYLELVSKIKKAYQKNKPGKLFSITSDIIVG